MATSNFIGSGWTSANGPYDQTGTLITSVSSRDIFDSMLTVGVYMINKNNPYYPVFCSCTDLNYIGIPPNTDNAWIVYPGYGIKLYSSTGWTGTASNTYYNTSSNPVYFNTDLSASGVGGGTQIYKEGYNSGTSNIFGFDNTQSVKVYFRGNRTDSTENEITIGGLTS